MISYEEVITGEIPTHIEEDDHNAYQEYEWGLEEALAYINEFKAIVKNENDYADLILANNKIIEYQEIYVEVKNNDNNELREKMSSIEKAIIVLAKQLEEQKQALPISEKKLITVKDFEEVYSIKEETQRKLRGRFNDPLPSTQLIERGNVLYDPKEIDKWLENYKKERN